MDCSAPAALLCSLSPLSHVRHGGSHATCIETVMQPSAGANRSTAGMFSRPRDKCGTFVASIASVAYTSVSPGRYLAI